jgi:hypothetical protein
MAATFADSAALAADPDFVARVTMAMVKSAGFVQAEDPNAANHVNRCQLAVKALHDTETYGATFAHGVAVNPIITAASTDGDIEFCINSLWDAYAGVV